MLHSLNHGNLPSHCSQGKGFKCYSRDIKGFGEHEEESEYRKKENKRDFIEERILKDKQELKGKGE